MELRGRRLGPEDAALQEVLALIRSAFSEHAGRINPPSSMHRMTPESLTVQAAAEEVWAWGSPLQACATFTVKGEALYLGKIAVSPDRRGQGLLRQIVAQAESCASRLGLTRLELESRVELTEVHAAFVHLGFSEVARTAHPGFDRPTSIRFSRRLAQPA